METIWNPGEFLVPEFKNNYALVVLNRPINGDKFLVEQLWRNSIFRLLVDGGSDRWMKFVMDKNLNDLPAPSVLSGDFDSASEESLKYFQCRGSEVLRTPNQDETDFTKALRIVEEHVEPLKLKHVVVLADSSGRMDQILANINTLFKAQHIMDSISVYLLSSNSISWLLSGNKRHIINIPKKILNLNKWCSLVPIGNSCRITTKGLKWDMTDCLMQFGGMVSTSNKFDGKNNSVKIVNDNYVLWSMGITSSDD